MVGGLSMVVDSHTCPGLCFDSYSTSTMNYKYSYGDQMILYRSSMEKRQFSKQGMVDLSSSFVNSWHQWRISAKLISRNVNRSSEKHRKARRFVIVDELAGQYEDSFEDVKTQMQNYFTYKAVRTVMSQLYEMNPTHYRWFYDFVATNKPGDGKRFLRSLVKERQDLAERVMVTRLHLYGKWIKKCDHAEIYKEISDENLELMRERLIETVIWPADDTNTEKIG